MSEAIGSLVLDILRWVVDISILWALVYFLLKSIKGNVKLSLLFKGILSIVILYIS